MRHLVVLATIWVFVVGCDVSRKAKNEKENSIQAIDGLENIDTDGDGIEDSKEVSEGLDPEIADFPQISTFNIQKSTIATKFYSPDSGEYANLELNYESNINLETISSDELKTNIVNNGLVRKKVAGLIHSKVFMSTINDNLIPTIEDALLGELGCLSDFERLNKQFKINDLYSDSSFSSHTLDFNYKFHFNSLLGVTEISQIEGGFFIKSFNNEKESELISLKVYWPLFKFENARSLSFSKLFENKLSLVEDLGVSELFDSNYCSYYKVQNFKFLKYGQKLEYAQVLSNVQDKNAHVFISTPTVTEWISINPSKLNIPKFLKKINREFKIDNKTEVISVGNLKNQITPNIHIEDINDINIRLGRWHFVSNTGENINQNLQAGGIYVLAFVTFDEMLKNSNFSQSIFENYALSSEVELKNTYIGDELEIIATLESKYDVKDPISKFIRGKEWGRCGYPDSGGWDKSSVCGCGCEYISNACKYTEFNENHVELIKWKQTHPGKVSKKNLILKVGQNSREIDPIYIDHKRIAYKIKVKKSDLIGTKLKIYRNFKTGPSYPVVRHISQKHRQADRYECESEFSKTEIQNVTKSTRLILNARRFGIIR